MAIFLWSASIFFFLVGTLFYWGAGVLEMEEFYRPACLCLVAATVLQVSW
jgi:hypothetical protein